tara:strand:- start:231 stop:2426 length:2196 start_codon:yes stop_codon:yes gene_type:complete
MSLYNPKPSLEGSDPQKMSLDEDDTPIENKWVRIARQIYEDSSEYLDSNIRHQWERSISLFNSQHPSGSKYNTSAYEKRSAFFRPKTRTAVRNLQAAMSVAFFTNEDVVSVEPVNPNDSLNAAAAIVSQSVMQYRLTNTIPWFETMTGALQDAAVQGVCISHQYWEFEESKESYIEVDGKNEPVMDEMGNPMITDQITAIKDRPVIELISPENIRIDPAAEWNDPIKSSPYIVHLIPMYLQDIRSKINSGEWLELSDEELIASSDYDETDNSTRLARLDPRMDPKENETSSSELQDFYIVWVHKNIVKVEGVDFCYFTAGTENLLTEPKPLKEMYPWLRDGERPYVMGCVNLESHKIYPAGTVELTQELQSAANDIWNQRFDNVKLAMNKRYHIRRDRNIDLDSLFRSVPGGAVEMDDPDTDVRVVETRDVTGSAYAEQDRINMDFDELQGNFSTSTVQGARNLNETVGGMNLLAGNSSTIAEYTLRTFAETWVEKVLKQLLRLEQYYETDSVILAVAGQAAEQQFARFNIDELMDELLRQDVLLKVNVGMNATDPLRKVQNLLNGIRSLAELPGVIQALNISEVVKEVFGQLGYKDGSRFISFEEQVSPEIQELQQQLQQLQQLVETDQMKTQGRMQIEQVKSEGDKQVAQIKAQTDIQKELIAQQTDIREAEIKHQDSITKRGELLLQKEALLSEMSDKEVERELELQASGKAGTIQRGRYNKVPYAVG